MSRKSWCCWFITLSSVIACSGVGPARESLPNEATPRVRSQASACDVGDAAACSWLAVWYLVGGAGDPRTREGLRWLSRACELGQTDACDLLRRAKASFAAGAAGQVTPTR